MSLLELHNVRLLGLGTLPPQGQQQAQQQQLQGFDHWQQQPWAGGEGGAGAGVVGGGGAAAAAADARPVVVLAHGFGTDQSCWQHVVPHLVGEYQVVLFDLMGAASTDPDHFCFARYSSLPAYAADLLAILDELRVERCLYVGHSMSGMIGCIASLQRPRLFAKIILLGASPRYINSPEYFGGFEQEDLNQLFLAMQTNYLDWAAGFAPLVIGADLESESVSEFSRTLFSLRPDIALNVARTVFQSDVRAILPQVTTPVHILQAMKDLAVPECVSQYMHRALGGKSVVEILPTHGHLPQLSSPEVVVPALLRHLRSNL